MGNCFCAAEKSGYSSSRAVTRMEGSWRFQSAGMCSKPIWNSRRWPGASGADRGPRMRRGARGKTWVDTSRDLMVTSISRIVRRAVLEDRAEKKGHSLVQKVGARGDL